MPSIESVRSYVSPERRGTRLRTQSTSLSDRRTRRSQLERVSQTWLRVRQQWSYPVRHRWATRSAGLGGPWPLTRGRVERADHSGDGAVAPVAQHRRVGTRGLKDAGRILGGFEPAGFCDRYGRTVQQKLAVPEAESGDRPDRTDGLRLPVSCLRQQDTESWLFHAALPGGLKAIRQVNAVRQGQCVQRRSGLSRSAGRTRTRGTSSRSRRRRRLGRSSSTASPRSTRTATPRSPWASPSSHMATRGSRSRRENPAGRRQ